MKVFKQETDKSCGVACLRSAFAHLGRKMSEKDIWGAHEQYHSKKSGIRNPIINLGVTAIKLGFKASYFGYNPVIANNNSKDDLLRSLQKKSRKNFDYGKFIVDGTVEFIKQGGRLNIDKLSLKKIKKLIDKHGFFIAEIKPAFINSRVTLNKVHKVIVAGYTKKGFKILNPSKAERELWSFDDFLLAFYAATPELLIIENK